MNGWMNVLHKTLLFKMICHYKYCCVQVLFIICFDNSEPLLYTISNYIWKCIFIFYFSLHSGAGNGSRGVHRHPHREAAPGGGVPREGHSPVPGGRGADQETEGALSGRQTRTGAGGGGSNQTGILGAVSTGFLIVQCLSDKGDHEATRMAN